MLFHGVLSSLTLNLANGTMYMDFPAIGNFLHSLSGYPNPRVELGVYSYAVSRTWASVRDSLSGSWRLKLS